MSAAGISLKNSIIAAHSQVTWAATAVQLADAIKTYFLASALQATVTGTATLNSPPATTRAASPAVTGSVISADAGALALALTTAYASPNWSATASLLISAISTFITATCKISTLAPATTGTDVLATVAGGGYSLLFAPTTENLQLQAAFLSSTTWADLSSSLASIIESMGATVTIPIAGVTGTIGATETFTVGVGVGTLVWS